MRRSLPVSNTRTLGTVQQQFVGARRITGGNVLVLGGGGSGLPQAGDQYCAVLAIQPVNYLLMAPEEQEAIITAFRSLINSLSFPLQILSRVTPLDVQPYLAQLRRRLEQQAQPGKERTVALLGELITDNIAFVQQLATRRRLLERHFYIVIPAHAAAAPFSGRLWARLRQGLGWFRRHAPQEALVQQGRAEVVARGQLDLRVSQVLKLLGKVGLVARRVQGLELAQLYQSCLVPQQAQRAPLAPAIFASLGGPPQARAPRSWARHRQQRGTPPVAAAGASGGGRTRKPPRWRRRPPNCATPATRCPP